MYNDKLSKTLGPQAARLIAELHERGRTLFSHADVEEITSLPAKSARNFVASLVHLDMLPDGQLICQYRSVADQPLEVFGDGIAARHAEHDVVPVLRPTPIEQREQAVVEEIEAIPVSSLAEAVGFFAGEIDIEPYPSNMNELFAKFAKYEDDFVDVRGQEMAKRAVTIAAAASHNLLML